MSETTRATTVVTVRDILSDTPPALLVEQKTRYNGGTRLFTMKVPVPDPALYQRLCAEVRKGDQIEVTIATEWTDEDSQRSLVAFSPVTPPIPVAQS